MKEWQEEGCNGVRLSMNLSGRQFQHQNLDGLLESVLSETELAPSSLVLEITETVAMQNVENTLAILHTLKKRGVGIALDDFGKGYSSLSYLKHFPIDIIKIDPSFVTDVGKGPQEDALVRSIIHLGHSMKRTIIAEGVETEMQHTLPQVRRLRGSPGLPPLPPAAPRQAQTHPPPRPLLIVASS